MFCHMYNHFDFSKVQNQQVSVILINILTNQRFLKYWWINDVSVYGQKQSN